jgi:hypothetical protein
MKQKAKEPDVDFIGGGRALTKEDEKAISDFLQARKVKKAKRKTRLSSTKVTRKTAKAKG